jgi:hypothetical protein
MRSHLKAPKGNQVVFQNRSSKHISRLTVVLNEWTSGHRVFLGHVPYSRIDGGLALKFEGRFESLVPHSASTKTRQICPVTNQKFSPNKGAEVGDTLGPTMSIMLGV